MAREIETLTLAQNYTDNAMYESGLYGGKPCTIKNIVDMGDYNIVIFEWTADDGTIKTSQMTVKDGFSPTIEVVEEEDSYCLIITTDKGTITTPNLKGGVADISPYLKENYYTKTEIDDGITAIPLSVLEELFA